jgi:hypothetical protein
VNESVAIAVVPSVGVTLAMVPSPPWFREMEKETRFDVPLDAVTAMLESSEVGVYALAIPTAPALAETPVKSPLTS